jgi:superfamily II DNA or RNA helicase
MIQLRDYQERCVQKLYDAFKAGYRRPILRLDCGAGKTLTMAEVCRRAVLKGNEVLFLVHRIELKDQTIRTFEKVGLRDEIGKLVKVGMVITVGNHLSEYNPKLIIADECNFSLAKSWRKVFDAFPDAHIIGLSATPVRLSGEPMGDIYDLIIEDITADELIENGYLCDYDYYAPPLELEWEEVPLVAGDYHKKQLEKKFDNAKVYGDVIEEFKKLAHDKKTIVFCTTIKHSQNTAEMFRKAGYRAEHIDANTPAKEREAIIERFRTGETQILCNCMLFIYGFDVPDCECVVQLRPTKSLAIYVQSTMRALRGGINKRAIILDFVKNYEIHGMPTDKREWSLDGAVKGHERFDSEGKLNIRQCENCFRTYRLPNDKCPYCGFVYKPKPHELKQIKEVQLQKIERENQLKKEYKKVIASEKVKEYKNISECKTVDEIFAFCKMKGYKQGYGYFELRRRGWIRK